MKRIAVSFTFFDDIKTVYGFIRSQEPLTVAFPPSSVLLYAKPEAITVTFLGEERGSFYAELVSFEDNVAVFKPVGPAKKEDERGGLTVDYKSEFTAAVITAETASIYLSHCREINGAMRNKLSLRLKEILKREDSENLEMFSFLFEMNTKLDEILSILRPPLSIEGGFEVRGVALCSSFVSFYSDIDLKDGAGIFVRLLLSETVDRFYFAAMGSLSVLKKNPDGSGIYRVAFSAIEEDIKDALVRFLFVREREILKEARV